MEKLNIHVDIKHNLYQYYKSKKIPHILFYGENGCGKKTLVMDFINMIYGNDKQKIKQNTLFSNCSHSKGIKHIRENLKEYSRSNVKQDENVYFKSIILYNFENLSMDGQSALRRVIEAYSQSTRFFLILQNKNKILQPILSRFAQIYIPLPIINGVPTNLYAHHLNQMFPTNMAAEYGKISSYIEPWFRGGDGATVPTHQDIVVAANELYENGITCMDIMNYIKSADLLENSQYANIVVCCQKIKSEYRNEKLLILYLFDYIFFREPDSFFRDRHYFM
jgi:hypothetical protein